MICGSLKCGYSRYILDKKEKRSKKERVKRVEKKKEIKENHCSVCGAALKQIRSKICQKCLHDDQRKVKNRPGKIQLSKMVIENGFESVGRQYGVSGKAVAKWLITYGLPSKKKDLEHWFYGFTGMASDELK